MKICLDSVVNWWNTDCLYVKEKPVKQEPRRFARNVMEAIEAELERLLKPNFIQTTRYVDWISNIVPIVKKIRKMHMCIDFRYLNAATPKDEYPMSFADMLGDSTTGNEILSLLDDYSGYNQIYIVENNVSKVVFRCLGALGTYEWIVMSFGLKNVGATYQRVMNLIFHDLIGKFMQVYIDVVVKSELKDNHLEHLRLSFRRMRKYGLKMDPIEVCFWCLCR